MSSHLVGLQKSSLTSNTWPLPETLHLVFSYIVLGLKVRGLIYCRQVLDHQTTALAPPCSLDSSIIASLGTQECGLLCGLIPSIVTGVSWESAQTQKLAPKLLNAECPRNSKVT